MFLLDEYGDSWEIFVGETADQRLRPGELGVHALDRHQAFESRGSPRARQEHLAHPSAAEIEQRFVLECGSRFCSGQAHELRESAH